MVKIENPYKTKSPKEGFTDWILSLITEHWPCNNSVACTNNYISLKIRTRSLFWGILPSRSISTSKFKEFDLQQRRTIYSPPDKSSLRYTEWTQYYQIHHLVAFQKRIASTWQPINHYSAPTISQNFSSDICENILTHIYIY